METLLEMLAAIVLAGVVVIDRWAIANYESSESARSWCKAQFLFSRDPRGAVSVSSYVVGVVSVSLFIVGVVRLMRGGAG